MIMWRKGSLKASSSSEVFTLFCLQKYITNFLNHIRGAFTNHTWTMSLTSPVYACKKYISPNTNSKDIILLHVFPSGIPRSTSKSSNEQGTDKIYLQERCRPLEKPILCRHLSAFIRTAPGVLCTYALRITLVGFYEITKLQDSEESQIIDTSKMGCLNLLQNHVFSVWAQSLTGNLVSVRGQAFSQFILQTYGKI